MGTRINLIFFCALGALAGFLSLLVIPYFPLSVENPLFGFLGIQKPRIVAFLPYFLSNRATNNYNPYITTLTYFGLTIGPDGHIVKLTNPQEEDPGWYDLKTQTIQKKLQDARNNHVTLSLTVVQEDEASISALLSDPQKNAQNLLSDITPIMQNNGFTDLNLDVESFQSPDSNTIKQFTVFVQTIKQGLSKQHLGTLTVDISPIAFVKQTIINPMEVAKSADYMLVMAYDYHTVLSSNTGPIAPIQGRDVESEFDVTTALTIAKKEVDPKKIILGIPLYGFQWDSLQNSPGSATIPNTGQTASNRRISDMFNTNCPTCEVKQDALAQEPDFVWQEKQGDSYYHQAFVLDQSAVTKRVALAKENNFAGVAVWALGYEGNTILQPLFVYKQTFIIK